MSRFKFNQAVLDKNRKLLPDSKYASSCPLFFRRTVVGQLQTETKVHEFAINGVKKFRVQTDATFDLCNAADPEVLTGRFIRTADTLDLRLPLAACAAVSTKPRSNPRLSITAQGAKRTVSVSTDLPPPTNLTANCLVMTESVGVVVYETTFAFTYSYSSENPPSTFLIQLYEGAYRNPVSSDYIFNDYYSPIEASGAKYQFTTPDDHPMAQGTAYVLQVQALNDAGNASPMAYLEFETPYLPLATNIQKVSSSILPDNQVQVAFSFDYNYSSTDPRNVPLYYQIMIREGTHENPRSSNFNLFLYDYTVLPSGETNTFSSLAAPATNPTQTPLLQNRQYFVEIIANSSYSDESNSAFYNFNTFSP